MIATVSISRWPWAWIATKILQFGRILTHFIPHNNCCCLEKAFIACAFIFSVRFLVAHRPKCFRELVKARTSLVEPAVTVLLKDAYRLCTTVRAKRGKWIEFPN